jgi:hypothetical protein
MENQNQNPEETGKKEFNLFDFLFGWMKSSPKEEPVKTENEDGSPRDPAEIEAETKEREEAKANAPKQSKAGMFTFFGIILLIAAIIALFIFANPFSSSKDGKDNKAKTEQATDPSQPGGGNTQPGGGNTQPGSQVTFTYDQSFDFSKMDQTTQDNLEKWETTGTINVDTDEIILKTEVKNYKGKTMVWLQIEGAKGKVKNIFTEPSNIKISL